MSLAIGWDTPEGVPTTPSFILLGMVLTALTIGVMLIVRRHDRKRLLAERVPYSKMVAQARQMAEEHAAQIAELHDQVARDTRITCEIRHHLTGADVNSQPFLKVVKDA